MARLKHRKFDRTTESAATLGATGCIKIGHSGQTVKNGITFKVPKKDNGFIICRNQPDATGNMMIDLDAMALLGCDKATIEKSMAAGIKGQGLPDMLHFAITCDAFKDDDDDWNHGATYSEQFESWSKIGLFCRGDGEKAHRRIDGGGEQEINCRPLGVGGLGPKECCEYSADKRCKTNGKLAVALFSPGEPGEYPQPLDRRLGLQALYKFETSSEYSLLQILAHLDQTAERVDGHIAGLTGVLCFGVKKRRTGGEKFSVGEVGMVSMHIDEMAIQARERALHDHLIEENKSRVLMLNAPEPGREESRDAVPEVVDPEWTEEAREAGGSSPSSEAPSADLAAASVKWDGLDLAGKSLDQILSALDRYIGETTDATGMSEEQATDDVLWFTHENGRRYDFQNVDYFRDPEISDRQREQRLGSAQAIAQRLLNDEASGFFIPEPSQ